MNLEEIDLTQIPIGENDPEGEPVETCPICGRTATVVFRPEDQDRKVPFGYVHKALYGGVNRVVTEGCMVPVSEGTA